MQIHTHRSNQGAESVQSTELQGLLRLLGENMIEIVKKKIAVSTGVLENIKQEFYRRVALPYEEKKIIENGDIKEYLKMKN